MRKTQAPVAKSKHGVVYILVNTAIIYPVCTGKGKPWYNPDCSTNTPVHVHGFLIVVIQLCIGQFIVKFQYVRSIRIIRTVDWAVDIIIATRIKNLVDVVGSPHSEE
ncbi:hypothetical protein D3C87_1592110 [compost metagenome]